MISDTIKNMTNNKVNCSLTNAKQTLDENEITIDLSP